ncbi:MAG: hypothetical protein HY272_05735 [Gammaproteobacteria bacterium]|nr:hypothetical protein [Gammaproteobacteria bacterium]
MTDHSNALGNINLLVTHAYGRAGSLFLQSLFDSHPNVLTLPHFGVLYSSLPELITDIQRQSDIFVSRHQAIFDTSKGYFGDVGVSVSGKFGVNGDEDLVVNPSLFKEKIASIASAVAGAQGHVSRREFFILVHVAYGLCLRDLDISDIKYIFYHPHSNEEWEILLSDFPGLYFIAMTRDPRQDWVSWKKIHALRMRRDPSRIPPICLFLSEYKYSKNCYYLSGLIERLETDHVRIIDLEKFHVMNRSAMLHLCSWLGLEFDETLMHSTFNGREWFGNSAALRKASSFNPEIKLASWRNELEPDEIDLINSLLVGSLGYLHYGVDIDNSNVPFETLLCRVKYASGSLLVMHCFLYIAGDPLLIFSRFERGYPVRKIVRGVIGKILLLVRSVPATIVLFRQLRGNGMNCRLREMTAQQKQLLSRQVPPQLFIDYYMSSP